MGCRQSGALICGVFRFCISVASFSAGHGPEQPLVLTGAPNRTQAMQEPWCHMRSSNQHSQ